MTDGAPPPDDVDLLTAREVAEILRVDVKTVRRWKDRKPSDSDDRPNLTVIRLPGGLLRYLKTEVDAILRKPSDKGPS